MKKIGLALGGGGAKGLAHIGVLKVLEEYKIPIDFISGSSMGAVIAALYSAEPNAKKIEIEALQTDWSKIFDYTLSQYGLVKGKKIEQLLEEKLNHLKFSDMKIPLYVTASDVVKNQEVIFHKGYVAKAVRASLSFPGVFIPVVNKGRVLVDGGVIDPIPTNILKQAGAEIIIAVNVQNLKENAPILNEEAVLKTRGKKIPSAISTTSKSFDILTAENCRADLMKDSEDLIIMPDVKTIGMWEFKKVKLAIAKGESAARASLKYIQELAQPHPFKQFLEELHEGLNPKKIVENVAEKAQEIHDEIHPENKPEEKKQV